MRSDAQILSLLNERKMDRGDRYEKMRLVRDAYNGDIVVPLPEVDEMQMPAVANLLNQGADAISQRIASTMPGVWFEPDRQGNEERERCRKRRDAIYGWWDINNLPFLMARRARFFTAYAQSIIHIKPDPKWGCPRYELRDPLTSYPAETDDFLPDDAIFTYSKSFRWLTDRYPDQAEVLRRAMRGDTRPGDPVTLVEYVDADSCVLIVMGEREPTQRDLNANGPVSIRLEDVANRIGRCPVVAAPRPGLDRPNGQFDGMIGMYYQQALLMALEVIAVKRGVFPDTWMVGRDASQPRIIREADGIRGVTGILQNGDVKVIQEQPGYMTTQTIDRLERAQRLDAKIPAEFGGESASNIRTGKRGDAVLAAVVDFPVQEAQRIFAKAMMEENRLAIAVDKTYFASGKKSIHVGWTTNRRADSEYVPADLWSTDRHQVTYSYAGADANGLVIGMGQRVGMGTMSKKTGMSIDPLIEDPEKEHDQVIAERLEEALLASVTAQAQQGAIPPSDLAVIMQLVADDDMELAEAIVEAQKRAQARQAAQVPATSPAAQPGLAQPGMGAESTPIQGPTPAMSNLTSLMGALRLPQRMSPAETGAA